MAQPYIGEIRMFAGNFAPAGWEFCDGRLLPISENDVLFVLIGTTYGGDGEHTFALPDLRGRVLVHAGTRPGGQTYQLAEQGGVERVTLTTAQVPPHGHPLRASTALASAASPDGNVLAQSRTAGVDRYVEDDATVAMSPQAVTSIGGSQPHDNLQPYLCINFIISLFGIFPSQT